MKKFIPLLLFASACTFLQHYPKRARTLMLNEGEIFQLEGNEFLLDSLILKDGSELLLDKRHNKATIRTNYLYFGKGCIINGFGRNGDNGVDGIPEFNTRGKTGFIGHSGVNLLFFISSLKMNGDLLIDLHGGNGGVGGQYGTVFMPSVPMRTGAPTIPRAPGGMGGKGGDVTISYPVSQDKEAHKKITITNAGGFQANSASFERESPTMKQALAGRRGAQGSSGKIKYISLKEMRDDY